MTEANLDQLLTTSVDSVLETMFFCSTFGAAEEETDGAVLESRLTFHGRPSGTFGVRLSEAGARVLAAGFLGEDEDALTDSQTGQVVCELANMLCGSLLSSLHTLESFDLTSPEIVACGEDDAFGPEANYAARKRFELEMGTLTVTLNLDANS
jgi:chemotaxis protein CheY-P-specific phosphatase CheC